MGKREKEGDLSLLSLLFFLFFLFLLPLDWRRQIFRELIRVDLSSSAQSVYYSDLAKVTFKLHVFAAPRKLVRQEYSRGLYPEHPGAIDCARERNAIQDVYAKVGGDGFGGEVYSVGYTKAMLQAALSL